MKRVNTSFYVLILSALAVSTIIISLLYKASPLFASKSLFLCQKLISDIMFEIPRSLPTILLLLVGGIVAKGVLTVLFQIIKTRIVLRRLLFKRISHSPKLLNALGKLSLKDKVILVKEKNLFSFCYGIFFPFIVISSGLVKSLTGKELEAVLLHEQSHLISKDPLKVLLGKTFSSMFFFLPIFRELHKNIEAVNELLADRWTIKRQNNSVSLRGALKKILAKPQLNLAIVSSATGADYFEIRIHRLVNPNIKQKFRLSLISLITTFIFLFGSWFLLQAPVSAHHDHMNANSEGSSGYYVCTADKSCATQCNLHSQKAKTYIPTSPFLPAKSCSGNSQAENEVSSKGSYTNPYSSKQ